MTTATGRRHEEARIYPAVVASPVDDAKHAHVVHGEIGHRDVDASLQHDAVLVDAPDLQAPAEMGPHTLSMSLRSAPQLTAC